MAAESSRSRATADSYIGSLIGLTSKSEIRYEGILYNINTDESSIGLRNVRSFGTEGRKKDGLQIPASDKIYEYILFRGSDIKDLQVKSSPPVPPVPPAPIHNDPAVIHSHFPQSVPASTSVPFAGSRSEQDSSQASQLGLPRSAFQGGPLLYQPVGGLGSWGATQPLPPTAAGSELGMPAMYWQGYYAPSGGLPPHLQQPPFLRQPPGLSVPQAQVQQPLQYLGINPLFPPGMPNFSDYSHPLLPPASSSFSLTSTPSLTSIPAPSSVIPSEISSITIPNKTSLTFLPNNPSSIAIPPLVPPSTSIDPVVNISENVPTLAGTSKPKMPPPSAALPYQSISQPVPSTTVLGSLVSNQIETSIPLVRSSVLASSQPLQESFKDLEAKLPNSKTKPSVVAEHQPRVQAVASALETKERPILPLPKPADPKPNGATPQTQQSNRRRSGRGQTFSSQVTRFTEDFDFAAMNEKFNKDEVWGHLGKTKLNSSRDREYVNDHQYDEDDGSLDNRKPIYVKDDFFDMLSCNALDRSRRDGRPKFSGQMKIDTERFYDFPSHHLGRGGGRGGHGGVGLARGSYHGGGVYGYVGRGRGGRMQNRAAS